MQKLMKGLNDIIQWTLFISFLVIVGCMLLQIVSRYIFNAPFSWTEETILFAFCWFSFLGCASSSYDKSHIEVDFIYTRLGPLGKKILDVILYVLVLALSLFMIGDSIYTMVHQKGMTTNVLRLPIGLYTVALPCGFLAIAIFSAWHLVGVLRSRQEH